MLFILKRTILLRQFFLAPKRNVYSDGKETNNKYMLKLYIYLDLVMHWTYIIVARFNVLQNKYASRLQSPGKETMVTYFGLLL